jgi:hypothetical protein
MRSKTPPSARSENGGLYQLLHQGTLSQMSSSIGELTRLEFRAMLDRIVPYMEIDFGDLALGAIAEVILGPKNITPDRVIWAALLRHGWGDVKVRRSEASYR